MKNCKKDPLCGLKENNILKVQPLGQVVVISTNTEDSKDKKLRGELKKNKKKEKLNFFF